MGEGEERPYSPRQFLLALTLSVLLGWAGVTIAVLGVSDWNRFLGLLPFAAVIGLPIAFLITGVVAGPMLNRVTQRSVTWSGAAIGGAKAAAMIAALPVVVGRSLGYLQSLDDSSYSRLGGGENTIEIDGILSAYGWQLLAVRTVFFIAFGAAVGLLIRLVVGPGNHRA
jgi:archaellum biogenesis protein FlaJ (TadC family)